MTKLVIDPKTERVLGVGIVGPGAGELIAEGVLAVEMGATAADLKLTIHPHPTLSETLMEAAEVFFGQSTHVYKPKRKIRFSYLALRCARACCSAAILNTCAIISGVSRPVFVFCAAWVVRTRSPCTVVRIDGRAVFERRPGAHRRHASRREQAPGGVESDPSETHNHTDAWQRGDFGA